MENKTDILGLSLEDLTDQFKTWGEKAYRAQQVYEWIYIKGAKSFEEMSNLSKELRQKLTSTFSLTPPRFEKFVSQDGTIKFRLILSDETAIESVWIPELRRNTLCISSQVGCPLKCAFCVTGVVGLKRNLTAGEVVSQVWLIKILEKLPISNIVFMGMGEPLLNVKNVSKSIDVLSEPKGLAVGRRRIVVSTAGIVPEIKPFVESTGVKLAISLTGGSDESRNHWMPINKKYDLQTLTKELKGLRIPKGKFVMFEMVIMKDENDSLDEAARVAKLLKGIPAKVNLIPYNENPYFPNLRRPEHEKVVAFKDYLIKHNVYSVIRKNRGNDILAACGQLAGK